MSFEDSFKDRVEKSLDRDLARIADRDPEAAAALRKVLEEEQVLPPITESDEAGFGPIP